MTNVLFEQKKIKLSNKSFCLREINTDYATCIRGSVNFLVT